MEADELSIQQEARRFNAGMNRIVQEMPPLTLERLELRLLSFHKDVLPPGADIREHEHPNYELAFVGRGGMTSTCDGVKVYCSSRNGRIFLMSPLTLHRRRFDAEVNLNRTMVFSVAGLDETGRQLCRQLPELVRAKGFGLEPSPSLAALRDELERQATFSLPLATEATVHCLRAFLVLCFQENFPELFGPGAGAAPLAGVSDVDRIVEIKRFVEHVMGKPVALEDFERHFGLSSRHLNRLFKRATGMTLGDYVARRKMAHAEELLLGSNASVAEVAKALGFKTASLFSIFFHKRKGRSPTAFRQ